MELAQNSFCGHWTNLCKFCHENCFDDHGLIGHQKRQHQLDEVDKTTESTSNSTTTSYPDVHYWPVTPSDLVTKGNESNDDDDNDDTASICSDSSWGSMTTIDIDEEELDVVQNFPFTPTSSDVEIKDELLKRENFILEIDQDDTVRILNRIRIEHCYARVSSSIKRNRGVRKKYRDKLKLELSEEFNHNNNNDCQQSTSFSSSLIKKQEQILQVASSSSISTLVENPSEIEKSPLPPAIPNSSKPVRRRNGNNMRRCGNNTAQIGKVDTDTASSRPRIMRLKKKDNFTIEDDSSLNKSLVPFNPSVAPAAVTLNSFKDEDDSSSNSLVPFIQSVTPVAATAAVSLDSFKNENDNNNNNFNMKLDIIKSSSRERIPSIEKSKSQESATSTPSSQFFNSIKSHPGSSSLMLNPVRKEVKVNGIVIKTEEDENSKLSINIKRLEEPSATISEQNNSVETWEPGFIYAEASGMATKHPIKPTLKAEYFVEEIDPFENLEESSVTIFGVDPLAIFDGLEEECGGGGSSSSLSTFTNGFLADDDPCQNDFAQLKLESVRSLAKLNNNNKTTKKKKTTTKMVPSATKVFPKKKIIETKSQRARPKKFSKSNPLPVAKKIEKKSTPPPLKKYPNKEEFHRQLFKNLLLKSKSQLSSSSSSSTVYVTSAAETVKRRKMTLDKKKTADSIFMKNGFYKKMTDDIPIFAAPMVIPIDDMFGNKNLHHQQYDRQ